MSVNDTIDLNRDGALTLVSVQRLLASASDRTHTQLRVTKAGIAFIAADKDPAPKTDDLTSCIESFDAGGDYVGPKAAADQDWVVRIHRVLKDNWPEPTSFYIDIF